MSSACQPVAQVVISEKLLFFFNTTPECMAFATLHKDLDLNYVLLSDKTKIRIKCFKWAGCNIKH